MPDAVWQEGWSLKVHGTVRLTRGIYRHMKLRGGGVVINIIGYAGDRVNGNYIIGSPGNASLIGFTRALGAVSPEDGIRVVGINPGPVGPDPRGCRSGLRRPPWSRRAMPPTGRT